MICLLVFICCLAAVTALTIGMVLKVVTTLVEAFLDIAVRVRRDPDLHGPHLSGGVYPGQHGDRADSRGQHSSAFALPRPLGPVPGAWRAFFASLIGSLAYLLIALACAAVMFLSDLLGELSMSLFNGMLGIMAKQSGRR